jgi:CDGSH-type Zn-finger protein
MQNGPILVEGDCQYVDSDGNAIETGGKTTVALCRCGASENKPFCDGTHSRVNFQG